MLPHFSLSSCRQPLVLQPLLLVLPSTEGVCDSGPAAYGVKERGEVRPERGELGQSERGQMAPKGRADLCLDSTCSGLVGQLLIPHRTGMREPSLGSRERVTIGLASRRPD